MVSRIVVDALDRGPLPDKAGPFHRAVAGRLEAAGFAVCREVVTPKPGQRRAGRVDLRASCGAYSIGIECDRRTPRKKSIEKLLAMQCDDRLILLRGKSPQRMQDGVHVLGMDVENG